MNEAFLCEAMGSFVLVRLLRSPTERVLEECQVCMLEAMRDSGSKAVLYDLTEMQPAPMSVLLYQRVLNEHLAALQIKRAIVVPNAQIAHLARLAFGGSDYRVFYDDLAARQGLSARRQPVHQRRLERAGDRGTAAARAPPRPPRAGRAAGARRATG